MAFKMKGFPMHGTTALKQGKKNGLTSSAPADNFNKETGTDFQEGENTGMPYNSALKQMEGMEEPTAPDTSWDTDGDGQMNDKERLAFLKGLGLTEKEMQAEMDALAEEYGSDDYDQQDYIDAARALAKRKKEGGGMEETTPMEYDGDLPRTKTGRTAGGY